MSEYRRTTITNTFSTLSHLLWFIVVAFLQEEALTGGGGPDAMARYLIVRERTATYRRSSGGPINLLEPVPGPGLSRAEFKANLEDVFLELRVRGGGWAAFRVVRSRDV